MATRKAASKTAKAPNDEWWRSGVIYQVYPRSYADADGDGIGDLNGITARLPYIAQLGADAVWLSPIFKSPMKDFGYDVSDYCDIDPMFGTLSDFKKLVARAHELKLKVVIDQVLSHSSDQHPWFVESRASRKNPKADWYVWADARHDGTPPNNWLSVFGGSAWQWDTRRRQYYLHNFLASQPDLNFHNVKVQDALLDTVKFWLELGVDGYRLDAINYCFHDAKLRNNPGRGAPLDNPTAHASNPYAWQNHKYSKTQPQALGFLRRLRALVDQYPHTAMVGEIGDEAGMALVAEYTSGGDKLHMGYCFDFLGPPRDAPFLRSILEKFHGMGSDGWPCWAISNHDCTRVATRWGGDNPPMGLLRLAATMQMTLQGGVCIYQGDELGLPEAQLAYEDLQDPYGITMWPDFKGRDGCRTPMPWDSKAPDLGFGSGNTKPWLPLAPTHRALAVDRQEADPNSLLHFYRRLLHWRRTQPTLTRGEIELLPKHKQLLAYLRSHGGTRMLCAFNASERVLSWSLPKGGKRADPVEGSPTSGVSIDGRKVSFEPWGMLLAHLS